jgi:hypothetical protein
MVAVGRTLELSGSFRVIKDVTGLGISTAECDGMKKRRLSQAAASIRRKVGFYIPAATDV